MSDALELYRTKKDLPIPDDKVDVKADSKVIAYQGDIGKNVLETIEYTESGLDPKYKEYFSYYLTKNKKYFQLMAFLEEENKDVKEEAFKAPDKGFGVFATDYSDKYPFVKGKKLGILTDTENNPIQKIEEVTNSGYLDISDVGDTEYKSIIANDETISGTGTALASTNPIGSCKRIKQIKGGSSDGTYTIDPEANGTGFKVYCDMTTDGGGWTLVERLIGGLDYSGNIKIDNFSNSFLKHYGISRNIVSSIIADRSIINGYYKYYDSNGDLKQESIYKLHNLRGNYIALNEKDKIKIIGSKNKSTFLLNFNKDNGDDFYEALGTCGHTRLYQYWYESQTGNYTDWGISYFSTYEGCTTNTYNQGATVINGSQTKPYITNNGKYQELYIR